MQTNNLSLDTLEKQRATILARVAALDETHQRTPTNSRVWSPLQIVQHLILAEEEYMRFIEEGDRQNISAKRPSNSPVMLFVLWAIRRRISFPTIPSMEPSAQTETLAELTVKWDTVRQRFRTRLEAVSPEKQKSPLALNPIMGPLNAEQMVTLMEAHQEYHMAQIPAVTTPTQK